ncbi:helix-turn-helix domain-containing protein [Streptomyces sp. NPDC018045]|uniref:helix-turn-helix domain-containing protein n=1 Tax=Streptomyces sp. NPDC018045 TaxID=3365037 RepID=UPI0037A46994
MGTPSGTDGFAALLRTLKTRSGLSYGALAKRLHMSTSTLHRYCNGDAVPTDYAPVERLARVCGAKPEELVELHRRWILADAARGRRAGAGDATPEGPGPGSTAPGEAGPDDETPRKAGPGDATPEGAGPGAAAPEEPRPGDALPEGPVPEPVPTAQAGSAARTETEPTPTPATTSAPEPDPTPAPEQPAPAPGRAPEPPPALTKASTPTRPTRRPARPKLRLALMAAAVVALAVPIVVSTTSSSGPGGAVQAGARVTDRGAGGGRGPVPDGGASGTPSASASASEAADEPKPGSASAGAGPSGAATSSGGSENVGEGKGKGKAGGSSGRNSGSPLTVDVRTNNWDDPCDRWYMLDKPSTEVPPPPSGPDARGWANALGGVPGGHLRVSLAVQGTGDQAVVLHSLTVRTTTRTASVAGSAYSMGNGCGGGLTPASFDVGLDAAQPLTRPVAGEQGDRKIPATDFPFKVSASDPQMLYVDAHAEANDVSWYLELEWSSGGRRGTLRLDDHGRPFRTNAMKGRPSFVYRYDKNLWEPSEN